MRLICAVVFFLAIAAVNAAAQTPAPSMINAGILNPRAVTMPTPEYPESAREAKHGGGLDNCRPDCRGNGHSEHRRGSPLSFPISISIHEDPTWGAGREDFGSHQAQPPSRLGLRVCQKSIISPLQDPDM